MTHNTKQIKLFLTVFLLVMNSFIVFSQKNKGNYFAFEQNARLGRGVNIIGYDPIWNDNSKARMKDKHFKLIKEAGFNNVRLVMSPFRFSMNDSTFTINPKFFKTLDYVIKESLKNQLMVIVDFHEHNAIEKDPLGTKSKILSMWKQIAEHCKGYSDDVLFEICNEPNMKPETWNEIHKEVYAILRKSNPDRTLIIGTINGNQIKHLKDLDLPEQDRNIIVAINYYSPIQFTHQGAPWSKKNKDLSGIEWTQSKEEQDAVKLDFDMAQDWSKLHNRPLTLGEFGAYEKADIASRVRWTNYIARQAELRKWSWSYWQFDSDFILYDIDKDKWKTPILNALIDSDKK
ncbi:glycoside hydrolase family 5 protein [Flavobacterium geliluteum]|uniref:Glycoside hydrolase family 5 protein n=1 Tax=Flavobacterium geliluteum TaxID=2816120 RepID=A0A941B515_9FLAO|nr:glycoside hydrolase family 5 protein [Flavobacterium geliluteum]MBP4140098.1 glycoside hydrolase family 5 protein [Flavobacterium geliluteum]